MNLVIRESCGYTARRIMREEKSKHLSTVVLVYHIKRRLEGSYTFLFGFIVKLSCQYKFITI